LIRGLQGLQLGTGYCIRDHARAYNSSGLTPKLKAVRMLKLECEQGCVSLRAVLTLVLLGIGNTGCIFRRGNSIFRDNNRLIATEEG
jgi:hypothetical protein